MSVSKNTDKSHQAYEAIKNLILSGEIKGGSLISENVLCRILNMSRTPIRNALKALEARGFVSIAPKQGIVVQQVSSKQHTEVYELRMVLEEYVLRELLPAISNQDIQILEKYLDEQKKLLAQKDVKNFLESDLNMHMFFFERYGNDTISEVMRSLREKVYLSALTALGKFRRMESTLKEHQLLVDAISKRDEENAIQQLKNHLKKGCSLLPVNITGSDRENRKQAIL